jgi:hypothetical protein
LLEIGRIASAKEEQACDRQSAEADETNNAQISGPRTSTHDSAPLRRAKFVDANARKAVSEESKYGGGHKCAGIAANMSTTYIYQ